MISQLKEQIKKLLWFNCSLTCKKAHFVGGIFLGFKIQEALYRESDTPGVSDWSVCRIRLVNP